MLLFLFALLTATAEIRSQLSRDHLLQYVPSIMSSLVKLTENSSFLQKNNIFRECSLPLEAEAEGQQDMGTIDYSQLAVLALKFQRDDS